MYMYLVCSPEEELQEVTGFPGREEGHVFRGNIGQRGTLTTGEHSLQGATQGREAPFLQVSKVFMGQHRAEGLPYYRRA
jgi:hypothetical protein